MEVATVCLDEKGGTRFRATKFKLEPADFTPPSPAGYWASRVLDAKGVTIMRTPAGYVDEWHPAPYQVLTILLTGTLRVDTSDGDHRIIKAGELFINKDITGRGHRLTEVNGEAYDMALIQLS